MECTLYWENCNCEECKIAKDLYDDIEFYLSIEELNNDTDFYRAIKKAQEEAIKELESMGYSY